MLNIFLLGNFYLKLLNKSQNYEKNILKITCHHDDGMV